MADFESEAERQLPFLDVRVQKDPDNKLHTSVYRKPTHTDQYLHNSSNHPPQIKRGIIATLARCAVNICSTPQQLKTELNHLQHVFTNFNDYPTSLVEQTINSILSPRERPPPQQTAPFVTVATRM
ncbi:uncharacterized protein LOC125381977 [Haliotis rufescens]|uniref:uncharacterized protein LOC125381977 n=1 Tax=Haliotis rufescens TaxID=6454 RepID=UPI00201FA620|nr:uncharacterized protein LOC125381977 [Haliotis rufescens]